MGYAVHIDENSVAQTVHVYVSDEGDPDGEHSRYFNWVAKHERYDARIKAQFYGLSLAARLGCDWDQNW